MRGKSPLQDSLVVCLQATGNVVKPLVNILNAVTGWGFTLKEALDVGLRSVHLMRAFDIRAGFTPEMEMPSARLLSAPSEGPAKGQSIKPSFSKMVKDHYRLMGWDEETGRPLPQTLKHIGLEKIIPDLWGDTPV